MADVHRQGDKNDRGAPIKKALDTKVFVNNLPISVDGSLVASHLPKHYNPKTANGEKKVMAGNKPINIQGSKDTCGHVRKMGSPNVKIGK